MGLLLSYSMSGFADKSGPSLSVGSMGSKAQAALIFGNEQINTINTTNGVFTITPLQNHAIANSYVRVLQSTTNVHLNFLEIQANLSLIRSQTYIGGKLGTAYVPGRLSKPALIFRSSMGNYSPTYFLRLVITDGAFTGYLAVSSALFALLTFFIIWAHFRAGKGEQFTLARIAIALDKSDIPSRFGEMKREADETRGMGIANAGHWEEFFIQEYGKQIVTFDKSDDSLRLLKPDA